jgi:hypothetical protein
MIRRFVNFVRGVSVHWTGKLGVILVTSAFITFLFLELLRLMGILTNAYIGLVTYLLFPTLFVIGLVLIPIGWIRYKRLRGMSTRELLREQFVPEDIRGRLLGSRLFAIIGGLTLLNVLFMVGASIRTLHFMDSARFCGTACHRVMNPEWTTYQDSPHARVPCVECHVGEGVEALIDSKLNGLRQMVLAATNTYNQPIPTPVHQLRPAQETCEHCHWPEKFYGRRVDIRVHHRLDRPSTPRYTTLHLKIDTGTEAGRAGIHWHVSDENTVRYTSVDDERETIIWCEVEHDDGSVTRYHNRRLDDRPDAEAEDVRVMDCVDCHNRATHIYEDPEQAIDDRIRSGRLDRSLPFIKREALAAITFYDDVESAMTRIRRHLEGFYARLDTAVDAKAVKQAVRVCQAVYRRNIHPEMKLDWNTYPPHIGHRGASDGCFRCHNAHLTDDSGAHIAHDCTMCHSMFAYDAPRPYQYLTPPADSSRERAMESFLRQEALKTGY